MMDEREVNDEAKAWRRRLRQRATPAERTLWLVLRNRRLGGYKFRRQHSIDIFVVDFACLMPQLAIECDGGYHEHTSEYDARRQRIIEQAGFTVMRFTNEDVLTNLEAVGICILRHLERLHN